MLDVVQVVPEAGDSEYSRQVRNGELRTYVSVNGRRVDYLNRHIKATRNEAPERVRIPIPRGLLHAGKNAIRIELTGAANSNSAEVRRPGDPPDRGGVPSIGDRSVAVVRGSRRGSSRSAGHHDGAERNRKRPTDAGPITVKTLTRSMVRHAHAIAREVGARVILLHADVVEEDCDLAALIQDVNFRVILVSRRAGVRGAAGLGRAVRRWSGSRTSR